MLLRDDGAYIRALERLTHALDACLRTGGRASCLRCRLADGLRPGLADVILCTVCGCCGLEDLDDDGRTIVCFGGCGPAGRHGPIERGPTGAA